MRGASALESLLAEFPDSLLRVQVVWEPVLRTDIAPPVTSVLGLVSDRRVSQYWDPWRIVSADLVRAVNENPAQYGFEGPLPAGFIAWDVVAVFSRSAVWSTNIPVPAHYAGPVRDAIAETRTALRAELAVARAGLRHSARAWEPAPSAEAPRTDPG